MLFHFLMIASRPRSAFPQRMQTIQLIVAYFLILLFNISCLTHPILQFKIDAIWGLRVK